MSYRLRIQCVQKLAGLDLYEQITHVGGAGSARWKLPVEEVIRQIRDGEREFFVERPIGDEVDVIVAVSPSGKKYLMTLADFDAPDTLLKLPPFRLGE
jgi:hypothetical protein